MEKRFRIIIAGGKTGGHLFPGIAVAQAVIDSAPDSQILFVGAGAPFEVDTLSRYGFEHRKIYSAGIKGKGIFERAVALFKIPVSLLQAAGIIFRFKPDIVLGVGGFASGPVVLGAKILGVQTAIQEQNSIAGVTNRILARFADMIFTSFEKTRGLEDNEKVILAGNPIRKRTSASDRMISVEEGDTSVPGPKNSGRFTLLVTGGSQGARTINNAIIDAVRLLGSEYNLNIIHQTGKADEERILKEYEEIGIDPLSIDTCGSDSTNSDSGKKGLNISAGAFFDNLHELQAEADLIICRAGAGTLSEITALGKPALLIPYPYAADDHQTFNARQLVESGAAWMITDSELSGSIIKEKLDIAFSNVELISEMAKKSRELGNPDAADTIASICMKKWRSKMQSDQKECIST